LNKVRGHQTIRKSGNFLNVIVFMNAPTAGKILAQRAIGRAGSGLFFIEEVLESRGDSTDIAYSRSWYILLSFNFELILNALIAFESTGTTNEEVIKDIMKVKPSHNFEKLFKK